MDAQTRRRQRLAPRFKDIKVHTDGTFSGTEGRGNSRRFRASFDLFLIRKAWDGGVRGEDGVGYEDLADGFGAGQGTGGDWSAIRDSSREAKNRMLERALNYLFA